MDCSLPGFPVLHHLLEFAQIHVHWVSDAIQPSHPLPSPLLLASNFPSIRIFSNESALHSRWPKYWSFSLSLSPYNEYSGLTSFKMDWSDLLAVQGTLKSLLQRHSLKASVLWCSAFFMDQLPLVAQNSNKSMHDDWKSRDYTWVHLCGDSGVYHTPAISSGFSKGKTDSTTRERKNCWVTINSRDVSTMAGAVFIYFTENQSFYFI